MKAELSHRILGGIWLTIVLIGPAGGLVSPHPATAAGSLDVADYTFVYPNLPDPAV